MVKTVHFGMGHIIWTKYGKLTFDKVATDSKTGESAGQTTG